MKHKTMEEFLLSTFEIDVESMLLTIHPAMLRGQMSFWAWDQTHPTVQAVRMTQSLLFDTYTARLH